ncbi:hypothetical protein B0A48_09674 [Cryoendolithus antarcticus]|uniref:Ras modification protein ERF4 n=1 Tax=Cryoendolithus antarcticus TaxID=1507870 RepID=A0A1V8T0G2_9PEZI|nr:hypothetical protein B0A48_09674 [Cryoendolithus antarcticus]
METLNKLAGVSDITSSTTSRPKDFPEPPPIPEDEAHNRPSRASLPLNRQPSHKSFRSRRSTSNIVPSARPSEDEARQSHETGSGVSGGEGSEDFEWGPQHPCYPHFNPHCAPDSDESRRTRVIRVKRDWLASGDLYPQYANLYPEILDPWVSDTDFRLIIVALNKRLEAVFSPFTTSAWVDAALGVVTGFLWDDAGFTGVKRGVKGIEAFVEEWNEGKRREGGDVRLVQLRKTGFVSLDFVVPDPGIDVAGEGVEDEPEH